MTLRVPKAVLIALAALLLVGIGVGGAIVLGGDDDSGDTAAETSSSTSTSVEETTPEPPDDNQVNEDIAEQMASAGDGKALANICEGIALGGRPQAEQEFDKQLAPLVIQLGGDVTEVKNLLLDRC